ncbi:hypothetical protein CC1G_14714 [Coprinopsis cinerea okayama7|uniref:Uncharacterized protein n=1 Tax=Coprinopsis cinerea (strain Okayama-7 / 130 / ATCC MYA-4618 / FGSC 9003) TaxID=240176 RepID=D6RN03_COPC7|nr:hypothetical protein CC1G_14714 [Coprinopsis cinerea okayama7\|eukprot:XP_002911285.1 hypothetical protein CC1G_14714 [Coprinopsis cinerea okayama7\
MQESTHSDPRSSLNWGEDGKNDGRGPRYSTMHSRTHLCYDSRRTRSCIGRRRRQRIATAANTPTTPKMSNAPTLLESSLGTRHTGGRNEEADGTGKAPDVSPWMECHCTISLPRRQRSQRRLLVCECGYSTTVVHGE